MIINNRKQEYRKTVDDYSISYLFFGFLVNSVSISVQIFCLFSYIYNNDVLMSVLKGSLINFYIPVFFSCFCEDHLFSKSYIFVFSDKECIEYCFDFFTFLIDLPLESKSFLYIDFFSALRLSTFRTHTCPFNTRNFVFFQD